MAEKLAIDDTISMAGDYSFEKQHEVPYKDEVYLVRDNGAVLRRARPQARRRRLDEVGRSGTSTGIQATFRFAATWSTGSSRRLSTDRRPLPGMWLTISTPTG